MARTKKMEINPIENVLKNIEQKTKKIAWNGVEFEVKNRLNIKELSMFVSSATDICFANSEDYMPEFYTYAVGVATIITYTDFKLPDSVEEQFDIITLTDLVSVVTENVEPTQYSEAVDAVNERIEYKIDTNINLIRKQATELFESVESVLGKLQETFSGIESEDMQGLIKSLATNGLDEEKIMKAYLENKK